MSRQFGIIVLVVGFAMGFAVATLLFSQGADDSGLQSRGQVASVEKRIQASEKHIQEYDPNVFSMPQTPTANNAVEDTGSPVSLLKSEEKVQVSHQVADPEAIRYIWGDLIDELGLDTKKSNELMRLYATTTGADRPARLREELGEAGYQAYLDYLPTLPLRSEIVPFKAELAKRNISLDRETEKMLLQIIREEQPPGQAADGNDSQSQEQIRQRIYHRASGIFSGEALSLFKAWGGKRL
jgi:hypothetical protein